jgi:A/G-specific adenine glycosylase
VRFSNARFARDLLSWFDAARRDLPWRVKPGSGPGARPPAYHVLVSEAMLQQTQVATVIPYFARFMEAFPTLADLAAADEQRVLRLWQGLGYYSRARNLRRSAQAIVQEFGGTIPTTVEQLLTLPGIGRYTAGAIASLAHDTRAPILDGNVVRVLCRIDAITDDPRDRTVQQRLWARAESVLPDRRVGDFNSALMELGATVCTPRAPACLICPVHNMCRARAQGIQDQIPPPKKAKPLPIERRWVFCVDRGDGAYLVEQRPPSGRWAGMWQFLSVPADDTATPESALADACAIAHPDRLSLVPLGSVTHTLTHRRYEFEAFAVTLGKKKPAVAPPRAWATFDDMEHLAFSKPQREIRRRLASRGSLASPASPV